VENKSLRELIKDSLTLLSSLDKVNVRHLVSINPEIGKYPCTLVFSMYKSVLKESFGIEDPVIVWI
jgi:hypothetical protein